MSNEASTESNEVNIDEEQSTFGTPLLEGQPSIKKALRLRRRIFDEKTVHIADISDEESKGWKVSRKNKKSARIKREKSHDRLLEDRVWTLCASLGYPVMNGDYFKNRVRTRIRFSWTETNRCLR